MWERERDREGREGKREIERERGRERYIYIYKGRERGKEGEIEGDRVRERGTKRENKLKQWERGRNVRKLNKIKINTRNFLKKNRTQILLLIFCLQYHYCFHMQDNQTVPTGAEYKIFIYKNLLIN